MENPTDSQKFFLRFVSIYPRPPPLNHPGFARFQALQLDFLTTRPEHVRETHVRVTCTSLNFN